jgi:cellulose synthase/poly-beta-1,6-N-acetylglucosamine synthase-like glycosyltransferase
MEYWSSPSLCLFLSVSLSKYISLIYLSLSLYICLCVCLSLSIYLSVSLSVSQYFSLSLKIYLCLFLFASLSVYIFLSLYYRCLCFSLCIPRPILSSAEPSNNLITFWQRSVRFVNEKQALTLPNHFRVKSNKKVDHRHHQL